jgi:hypothetical protein
MPIGAMNIGELRTLMTEILETSSRGATNPSHSAAPKRYVYGIKGIEELFGCSHATAQHYKDTVIADAVTQNGRKIVVDADYAVELFGRRKDNAGK